MSDYQQCNIHKHWLVTTALFGTESCVAGQEGAPHSPTPASALNSLRGGWEISMFALKVGYTTSLVEILVNAMDTVFESIFAAFGRSSVALIENCGRMGSAREAYQLSRNIAAMFGYREISIGVYFVGERWWGYRIVEFVIWTFGAAVSTCFGPAAQGKMRGGRWPELRPHSMSIFMHGPAVSTGCCRMKREQQRLAAWDPVNRPTWMSWSPVPGVYPAKSAPCGYHGRTFENESTECNISCTLGQIPS